MKRVDLLHVLAIASLGLGVASATLIAIDTVRRPQQMAIMNVVWPVTALFGHLLVMALYLSYGRAGRSGEPHHAQQPRPFPVQVEIGTLHCGSGCALGDLAAEWLAFAVPAVAVAFGWHGLFAEKTYAVWILDFLFAFAFGIVFQYFAIVPMRKLAPIEGIAAALKADAASLAAWQIGMYAFMAFAQFRWFPARLGHAAPVDSPAFWAAMQCAMLTGFATSYPVNAWLIRSGIKEAM